MSLLIDGYNLLHATGIFGRGRGPGGFERTRLALLNFLAESIDPAEIPRTTIVFDAALAPPGLPRVVEHRGLTVRFASDHEDADELIEELIRADSAPRQLTVISSDHRLHRAAHRRKARPVDSDQWYAHLLNRRRRRQHTAGSNTARSATGMSESEVNYWVQQFSAGQNEQAAPPQPDLLNPFPPGYGEDITDAEV
jgi:uncharacterized protein